MPAHPVMDLDTTMSWIGTIIDVLGVAVIALGIVVATAWIPLRATRLGSVEKAYRRYREIVGRSLLLGLEFLVAGDIIRTVAVRPTFTSMGVLVIIVLIRTFLSWTLEDELSGRFPWQREEP